MNYISKIESSAREQNNRESEGYDKNKRNWLPILFLRWSFDLRFSRPEELKKAIMAGQLSDRTINELQKEYPNVFTVGYPE